MKIKHMMIVFSCVIYGINMKAMNHHPEGLASLKKASNGNSLVFQYCEKNFTSQCAYLDTVIVAAINHHKKSYKVKALERDLLYVCKEKAQPALQHTLRERVEKERINYPHYDKQFSDTLSKNDQEALNKTLQELTKDIKNEDLRRELYHLDRAFNGYGPAFPQD